ncbi:FAD-binding protein, partial [Candidatus Latescibacterota bacterium]
DIVARTIDSHLKSSGEEYVYLDVTGLDADATRKRFPNIYDTCLGYGIDITKEPVPVVPAAHYMCGGVATDDLGCTSIANLYAVGEVAFTGLHGANRLASNSLLEAVVMADRTATVVREKRRKSAELPDVPEWSEKGTFNSEEWIIISHDRNNIQRLMWDLVGIVRSDFRLRRAMQRIELIREEVEAYYRRTRLSTELIELRNLAVVAWLIVLSARHRKESRGLHYNTDYPYRDDEVWKHDTYIQNEEILS